MRHNKIAVFVHVVWGTWDRLPLLTPRIAPRVYAAIGAKCEELGAEVVALGGVEDHLHLLVRLPATLAVAGLVKQVKGASSHLATHEGDAVLFRWQGAYGAFSVGMRDLEQVSAYIRGQREHHAAGSLVAEWELEGVRRETVRRGAGGRLKPRLKASLRSAAKHGLSLAPICAG